MSNKSTKKALLTSVLALVLCMSMLIGTTFAWFTDTTSTSVNTIQSGKLDAEMFYKNEAGVKTKFVADATFALFPEGQLGSTWFGTTPEESDLMSSSVANVSVVDTGVAITTVQKADPVNVETKVTMICLPSFEMADHIYILSTVAA